MALGEKLCNARLALKETTSQVAAATHMKVQTVEDIEREDFRRIPAAIYAKGFIKLYAEHVGLDPAPLIAEYMARFSAPGSRNTLDPAGQPRVQKILRKEAAEDLTDAGGETQPADDLFALAAPVPEQGAPEPLRFDPESRAEPREAQPGPAGGRPDPRQLLAWFDGLSKRMAPLITQVSSRLRANAGIVGASVAGAVIVLVVVAILLMGRDPESGEKPTPMPHQPQPLRLVAEPPDPYVD